MLSVYMGVFRQANKIKDKICKWNGIPSAK